jgi:hypothetical protein
MSKHPLTHVILDQCSFGSRSVFLGYFSAHFRFWRLLILGEIRFTSCLSLAYRLWSETWSKMIQQAPSLTKTVFWTSIKLLRALLESFSIASYTVSQFRLGGFQKGLVKLACARFSVVKDPDRLPQSNFHENDS